MKTRKPTTDSNRHVAFVPYKQYITASEPYKPLTGNSHRKVGRNTFGRVTSQHKGGGHKRLLRDVDFLYNKKDMSAVVDTIEYDPNRSAFIALVRYADGERRYIVAPSTMKVGDKFIVSNKAEVLPGNRMQLKNITAGTFVYNVELKANGGAKIARSAGNFVELLGTDLGYASLKMPSSEVRKVTEDCFATVGIASNIERSLRNLGKAGRSRWLGIRPKVRGTAMNPVDHPYGGGEGVQGRGTKRPKTRFGKVTGGHKSRTPKKYSNVFIVTRRIKKKRV
ncbi:MAG: 50S ribosomal protein L2 [Candidatus Vogelbacteria bacterium]|nr:50S ribosomal protein L2 [Candidatus Vogelbacteria bacterium]